MPTSPRPHRTIGVFDSGFGGLTVLRELLALIPSAHFVYLGDTARLPYGAKSRGTVSRYAVEAARFLTSRGAGLLVIACNTATALALEDIRQAVPVLVIGVIEPAVHLAQARFPGSKVLVLATSATVASHAYRDTCAGFGLQATEKACPLLVPLIEEGWIDHPVTREVLRIYLGEALGPGEARGPGEACDSGEACGPGEALERGEALEPDQVLDARQALAKAPPEAVLLGCTHYPLLSAEIHETLAALGSRAAVIDSAQATAMAVKQYLPSSSTPPKEAPTPSTFECFATDSVEKFAQLGSLFLGRAITHVHLLDLGG